MQNSLDLIMDAYEAIDRLAAVSDHLPADLQVVIATYSGERVISLATSEANDTDLRMALRRIAEAVSKLEAE